MPETPDTTDHTRKAMRLQHPLYKKLSGEVVWCLLEENAYSPEYCDWFMDKTFADMYEVLDAMVQLSMNPDWHFVYELNGAACSACQAFAGKLVAASTPQWQQYLPPFAVGCSIRCRVITSTELQNLQQEKQVPQLLPLKQRPTYTLLCPLLEKPTQENI